MIFRNKKVFTPQPLVINLVYRQRYFPYFRLRRFRRTFYRTYARDYSLTVKHYGHLVGLFRSGDYPGLYALDIVGIAWKFFNISVRFNGYGVRLIVFFNNDTVRRNRRPQTFLHFFFFSLA